MDDQRLNQLIKFSIIGAIALISFSVFYFLVIFLPSREREKNNLQMYKVASEKVARSKCQTSAVNAATEYYKQRSRQDPRLFPYGEGIYLKGDYESYYKECLRSYGLEE